MSSIVANLVSIGRQITLNSQVAGNFNSDQGPVYPAGLGCHFRWACGFNAIPDWNSLKSTNDKPIERVRTTLGGNSNQSSSEQNKVWGAIRAWAKSLKPEDTHAYWSDIAKNFGGIRKTAENAYGPTPAGTPSGPTFVVMSDNINSYTPEFPKSSGIHDSSKIEGFKTSDFVQWLIRNNYGIVVGSPVGRNHWHQNSENFSLVQAWFWIPPHHASFTVPDSHYITGLNQQVSWDKWYDDIRKTDGMSKRTNEQIDARLWKGGHRNSHLDAIVEGSKAA